MQIQKDITYAGWWRAIKTELNQLPLGPVRWNGANAATDSSGSSYPIVTAAAKTRYKPD